MSAAKTAPSDWITSADALRRHPELSRVKLYRLAASQLIRTTVPPGSAPRYSASDVDRVMLAQNGEGR